MKRRGQLTTEDQLPFKQSRESCFICLGTEIKSSDNQFLLQNVACYLRHHFHKSSLELKEDLKLCERCHATMEQFNELYHIWEETNLRLAACLEKLYDVMKETNKKLKNDAENEENDPILDLRAKLVNDCEQALNSIPPRVVLERLHVDLKLVKHHTSTSPPQQIKIKEELEQCQEATPSNSNASRRKVQCPDCSSLQDKRKLPLHQLSFHCEHLFPDSRLPSVTERQFKQILVDLLFQNYTKDDVASCSLCGKKFNFSVKRKCELYMKFHLLNFHRPDLLKTLDSLQKDPNLSRKLSKCNPNGVWCDCGIYLFNKKALNSHQINCIRKKTPESTFNSDDDEASNSEKCQYCQKTIKKAMPSHVLRFHVEHLFPNTRKPSVTPEEFRGILEKLLFKDYIDDKKCQFCKKKWTAKSLHVSRHTAKLHMLKTHKKVLLEKLNQLQNKPDIKEQLQVYGFYKGDSGKKKYRCEVCGRVLSCRNSLWSHKAYSCSGKKTFRPCDQCGKMVNKISFFQHRRVYCPGTMKEQKEAISKSKFDGVLKREVEHENKNEDDNYEILPDLATNEFQQQPDCIVKEEEVEFKIEIRDDVD